MMSWLMRASTAPIVLDGLQAFQITGSPIPALLALAAPFMRRRPTSKGQAHV